MFFLQIEDFISFEEFIMPLGMTTDPEEIKKKPIYIGLFLDEASNSKLFSAFAPKHETKYGHHTTIKFKPTPEDIEKANLGQKVTINVIGYAEDEKGQAVVVSGIDSGNKNPHITISTASGTSPVYSNELLETGYEDISGPSLTGTIGLWGSLKKKEASQKGELIMSKYRKATEELKEWAEKGLSLNLPPELAALLKETAEEEIAKLESETEDIQSEIEVEKELAFASVNDAVQYLSDLTENVVKIASDDEEEEDDDKEEDKKEDEEKEESSDVIYIKIETGNAAFEDNDEELKEVLNKIAQKAKSEKEGSVNDSNGNAVARFSNSKKVVVEE
jgi:hypothetical protein